VLDGNVNSKAGVDEIKKRLAAPTSFQSEVIQYNKESMPQIHAHFVLIPDATGLTPALVKLIATLVPESLAERVVKISITAKSLFVWLQKLVEWKASSDQAAAAAAKLAQAEVRP